MNFEEIKNSVLEMKAQKKAIEEEINELEDKLDLCALNIDGLTKAREFFQQQAEETQKEIVDVISGLISVALSDIFPEPYSCIIETGIKRNSTE